MSLPYLSFGCHNLTAGSSRLRSERLVHCALDLGIRRFDVAPSYGLGTAERMLSDALGPRRSDPVIEITTKFGILPTRHGTIKAWLREPVRLARQLAGRATPPEVAYTVQAPARPLVAAAPDADPRTPTEAAERSLRALRVDRLGAFLTHEAVAPDRRKATLDGLRTLHQQGTIARFGHSGELANVVPLLQRSPTMTDIGQVSILDLRNLPLVGEARGFNLSRLARRLLASTPLHGALVDELGAADQGSAISAVLGWAHHAYPHAVFLVNASTPARLIALVTPLADGRLSRWIDTNAASMAALAAHE